MAEHQQIEGEGQNHREQPLHDDARDEEIVDERVAHRMVLARLVERILPPLLVGQLDAFGRWAETAQQGEDGQRDDRQHGDLPQRVEAAEIDEDRSEEQTSELQSLMRNSYAGFCLKKKTIQKT